MDFDSAVKEIKRFHSTIFNKESDVILTYKGMEYGVTKPYICQCGSREKSSETYEDAAIQLLESLKEELVSKIVLLESQASSYKKILNTNSN
jgi:hypothetical protein